MKSFLLLLFISCSSTCTLAAFTELPLSFNASQGSTVTFHCEINETGNILFWLINGGIVNSNANRNRSVSLWKLYNRISRLTIEAHPWNNDVEIQCAFRPYTSVSVDCNSQALTCSEKAILRIQGLLSAPPQFSGEPQLNISVIHLTWMAPTSLDLTDVDPDIMFYEIFVFDNATGERQNFTSKTTEFTYHMEDDEKNVDTCQELEFSVQAVNPVGRGKESNIWISLHAAPTINLIDNTGEREHSEIECTTTCNNILAWRLHHTLMSDHSDSQWYRIIGKKRSGNQCTETIVLSTTWSTKSVNSVTVQCVEISLCSSEVETCVQSACLSDIHEVLIGEYHPDTTAIIIEKNALAINRTTIIMICASCLCSIFLCSVVIILAAAMVRAATRTRTTSRRDRDNREERIYESPADVTRPNEDYHTVLELCNKDPGSLYSLPLPTDPCPAYETAEIK